MKGLIIMQVPGLSIKTSSGENMNVSGQTKVFLLIFQEVLLDNWKWFLQTLFQKKMSFL